ncbi:MAG: hypothetical protein HQ558_01910 [Candidatus Omnitrophica bacterium]|nr:hypothetical protein [Candidatus Omnitrophota bacterium]
MKFGWETEEEKLLRCLKISPKKRLEWLQKMHEFTVKTSSKHMLARRWKLREAR